MPIDDVDRVVDARPAHADVIASRRVLEQIIDEQDERGLSIVVAHFVHGMTQEEIAAWLGVSRRAVVKRLTVLRTRYMHLFQEAFA